MSRESQQFPIVICNQYNLLCLKLAKIYLRRQATADFIILKKRLKNGSSNKPLYTVTA